MGTNYTHLLYYIYKILWHHSNAYASSLPSIRLSPSRSRESLHMDKSDSEARLNGRSGRESECLLSSSSSSRLGDAVLQAVFNGSSVDVVVVDDAAAATAAAAAAAPLGN